MAESVPNSHETPCGVAIESRSELDNETRETSGGSRSPVILWIVPTVLAIVLPGLIRLYAEQPMAARPRLFFAMTIVVAAVAGVILLTLIRISRRSIRWSLGVTTMIVLILFQWPILTSIGHETLEHWLPLRLLQDAVPVLLACTLLWLAARLSDDRKYAVLIGTSLLFGCSVLLAGVIPRVVREPSTIAVDANADGPDVLVLILDGYARSDVLMDRFEYDNSEFEAGLEALGFTVAAEATANYNYTHAAIPSILELDYVLTEGAIEEEDIAAVRNALAGEPDLFSRFRRSGYDVAYTENYWSGSHCGAGVDVCWRDGRLEQAVWTLGRMTIFAPLVQELMVHPFNPASLSHLKALPDIVAKDRTERVPRLTVAHILLPHQPYLLNTECEVQSGGPARESLYIASPDHMEVRQQYYADQVGCTNKLVVDAVDEIVRANPATLIMITADHGTDSTRVAGISEPWTTDQYKERMSIFSAYRLPGCVDSIQPAITPVNGIRTITNCALGTDLPLLPDKNLWIKQELTGEVLGITDRLSD